MKEQGNFFTGLLWGTTLSIPLWMAFFGWVKIILHLFKIV
ncbi:hypothetical protein BAVI_11824 [Neobacillus vireti LMG 21834]|uniref:Uncharacterized protein n=1 Tax=Neobacillus vireti LMG 21834 TaxID=1131730 RepID=A0AB94INB5_9BACI|nr:hypothetical protein BAVI_11824 [Neobacillus vireti LMG 21834]